MKKIPIGATVRVGKPQDELMDQRYMGLSGVVAGYNTNGATGNTEEYPLYEVRFEIEGHGHPIIASFWRTELTIETGKPKTKQKYNETFIAPGIITADNPPISGDGDGSEQNQLQTTDSGRDVFDLYPEAGEGDNVQRSDILPDTEGV
jgi:hypothetical protein